MPAVLAPRGTSSTRPSSWSGAGWPARTWRSSGTSPFDEPTRAEGRDVWRTSEFCVTEVLRRGVPGDLIETGVWRGGATHLHAGDLEAYGDTGRHGLGGRLVRRGCRGPTPRASPPTRATCTGPVPSWPCRGGGARPTSPATGCSTTGSGSSTAGSRDTLPAAPIERLAVLRLDGDMYESTMDALRRPLPEGLGRAGT